MNKLITRFGLAVVAIVVLASSLFLQSGSASAKGFAGYVYTESNAISGNQILVYGRGLDGSLTTLQPIDTGGTGTGAGLGSQGALALAPNGKWLLAVNAGSSDISVINVQSGNVTSQVSSGGKTPTSLTMSGHLVYVLNHDSDEITGFRLTNSGQLVPIPNSTQPLSGTGVDAKEIGFNADGDILVVTEKATNLIDTYNVEDGVPTTHIVNNSNGPAPFGFAFGPYDTVVVSEAAQSAATSYRVPDNAMLKVISGSVMNGQQAACWVVITGDGRYAYTADAHNGEISSYTIGKGGTLTLLNGTAGSPGGSPLDEAVSRDSNFLYVVNPGVPAINGFQVNSDGSLVPLAGVQGIPLSAAGLVAR